MKRYKAKNIFDITEDNNGHLVLYADVLELMQIPLQFAIDHMDDIENDVDGFGDLMPLVEFIKGKEKH
jgi:hypothetical protein